MAVYQVRNGDFAPFLEATGHAGPPGWHQADFDHLDLPATAVSLFEAADFCGWLTRLADRRYRLPTEAEWGRAVRGALQHHSGFPVRGLRLPPGPRC
jgi:formylglycine-generating enzyme required for sulfatase activity